MQAPPGLASAALLSPSTTGQIPEKRMYCITISIKSCREVTPRELEGRERISGKQQGSLYRGAASRASLHRYGLQGGQKSAVVEAAECAGMGNGW
jgi:hypothetical protein